MDARRFFSFDGRIGRGHFWRISIACALGVVLASALSSRGSGPLVALALLLNLALAVILLATSVKRLHDRGKPGWMVSLAFIPILGTISSLIELGFAAGAAGQNRYGWPASGSPFDGDTPVQYPYGTSSGGSPFSG